MALETGTYIDDLVTTNPIGASDFISKGDDHLRLLKTILQNTFPGFSQPFSVGATTGSGNGYEMVTSPAPSSLLDKSIVIAVANHTCTGASTFDFNGLGAAAIKRPDGSDTAAGDIESGRTITLQYDLGNTVWRIISAIPTFATKAYADAAVAAKQDERFQTGDIKATFRTTADTGWVLCNDGSIGSAGSGATNRANADTEELYELLWNNVADAWAPVAGGRGASAQADFDADKALTIPRMLGRALIGAGNGTGLTSRSLGERGGSEDAIVVSHVHGPGTLATNSDTHSHGDGSLSVGAGGEVFNGQGLVTGGDTNPFNVNGTTASDAHSHSVTSGTTASTGSSGTDQNSGPWTAVQYQIKL